MENNNHHQPTGVIAVAKMAGVSPATVSRVLTGASYVAEPTRVKVEKAIELLHYQPNRFAQALITHKSQIIGILLDQSIRYATSNVLVQIEALASQMGYTTVVQTIGKPFEDNIANIMLKFKSVMIEGLIGIAPRAGLSKSLEEYLDKIPMVLITTQNETRIPAVCEDQYAATTELMELLYDSGSRIIWHIAGSQEWFDEKVRCQAWNDFMDSRGLTRNTYLIQCTWDAKSAFAAIDKMKLDPKPDAIFAASDNLALATISALNKRGFRVPEDIVVVGFDDNDFASYTSPPLTTINQDLGHVARKAVDLLLKLIGGKKVKNRTMLKTMIRVRQSHQKKHDEGKLSQTDEAQWNV